MKAETLRTFTLTPAAGGDEAWELVANSNGRNQSIIQISGKHLERMRPALAAAVIASKHPRTILSPTRKAPIPLTEDAGVRLALTHLATHPIGKPDRRDAIRFGIDAMTSEEALYWYALCTGPIAARALRALRTLLAEE